MGKYILIFIIFIIFIIIFYRKVVFKSILDQTINNSEHFTINNLVFLTYVDNDKHPNVIELKQNLGKNFYVIKGKWNGFMYRPNKI